MRTALSVSLALMALGCAGSRARIAPAATPGTSPPAAATPRPEPVALPPVVGFSESGGHALQIEGRVAPGGGGCRAAEATIMALELCSEAKTGPRVGGFCVGETEPVKISGAATLCGTALHVAVEDRGETLALASEREGLFLRTKDGEPLKPVAGFVERHRAELPILVGPASLLFFSEDRQSIFLVPLEGAPVAVDLATRAEVPPTLAQTTEVQRLSLIKARIRLMAKDDRLKEVGLRWALRLGDTRNIDVVARIAATSKDAVLTELAGAIMEGYRRWLEDDGKRAAAPASSN